eukprot:TRINITY_DN11994_c0_g2_i5.p1 TRINITY_DN11994_c0_g2~~TRINITY_DN11994_c0_g2_i5.p1  ORF type:complete len:417 (-),score=49.79 TRINITY_DN11994_c0_g2_i5:350-1600(-)
MSSSMLVHAWSSLKSASSVVNKSPAGSSANALEFRFEALESLVHEVSGRLTEMERKHCEYDVLLEMFRSTQEQICQCMLTKSKTMISKLLRLAAVSKSHTEGVRECFGRLSTLCGPVLCRCGGYEGSFPSAARTVECFDASGHRWERLPPLATGRIACAAVSIENCLYVIGGCNAGLEDLTSAEVFDTDAGFWRPLPPMPDARRLCTAAACDGKLYVFGRGASSVSEPMALCFRPDIQIWEEVPRMSASLPCVALACGGYIYVFSCADELKAAATAERYDPKARSWETLPNIPTSRRSFGGAAVSGMVYICGGMSHGPGEARPLANVDRFNPQRGIWEQVPPMHTARGACSAASAYGLLYVCGGSPDDVAPLGIVERFDPDKSSWEYVPTMQRSSLLCGVTTATCLLRRWQGTRRI